MRNVLALICLLALPVALMLARPSGAQSAQPQPSAVIALSVDAGAGRHTISPDIYGMNLSYGLSPADADALAQGIGLTVQRWGGNITSRYNWKNNLANHGSDFYFENIPEDLSADQFISRRSAWGARTLLTVPAVGYVAKDVSSPNRYDCGFSTTKYAYTPGPLYPGDPGHDTYNPASVDCGTGVRSNGTLVTGNDVADTSVHFGPAEAQAWVAHLVATHGTASAGGVPYYAIDNEPGLWFETHRDVHPAEPTYAELADLGCQYAAAIKAADPGAQVFGPVQDGWTRYFYASYGSYPDVAAQVDRDSHGGTPFVAWYLAQMQACAQASGVRLLDYLDLHYYPANVSLAPAGDVATQALRLRSTRSLWDASYVDESYIKDTEQGNTAVQLIPRMRAWVEANYPGTKLAITEYNWGALDALNGALAQADVLGIFGREGLDLATLWEPPTPAQPGTFAFRIFRNYDGAGAQFGETSVAVNSADQGALAIYAAQRSQDGALTVVVINKSAADLTGDLSLAGITPVGTAAVYRYSAANLGAIIREADLAVGVGGLTTSFPAQSISLLVIPTHTLRLYLPLVER
jgi:hypothetical protein